MDWQRLTSIIELAGRLADQQLLRDYAEGQSESAFGRTGTGTLTSSIPPRCVASENPNKIPSSSPMLRRRSYLGFTSERIAQPQRGCGPSAPTPRRTTLDTTPLETSAKVVTSELCGVADCQVRSGVDSGHDCSLLLYLSRRFPLGLGVASRLATLPWEI
jgi:hypothetical protein